MGLVHQDRSVEKSMAKVCILDILSSATAENPLTQVEIQRKLSDLYGIDLNRKTVGNHLKQLISNIDSIKYRIEDRTTKAEATDKFTDFYIEEDGEFEDSEILALIYSVIFSRHMPTKSKTDLVKKLEALTPTNMKKTLKNYLSGDVASRKVRNQLFWNLDQLSEAIEQKKQVTFDYTTYFIGNGLEEHRSTYTLSPLCLGVSNNDIVLIGFAITYAREIGKGGGIPWVEAMIDALDDKQECIFTFKLDRMSNIGIEEAPCAKRSERSILKLKGAHGDDLIVQEYLEHNPDLELGHSIRAIFLIGDHGSETADELVDLFGKINVSGKLDRTNSGDTCTVTVTGNKTTIRDFALRNAGKVELLKPEDLRNELLETFEAAAEKLRKAPF